jgi:hypothetical protein
MFGAIAVASPYIPFPPSSKGICELYVASRVAAVDPRRFSLDHGAEVTARTALAASGTTYSWALSRAEGSCSENEEANSISESHGDY